MSNDDFHSTNVPRLMDELPGRQIYAQRGRVSRILTLDASNFAVPFLLFLEKIIRQWSRGSRSNQMQPSVQRLHRQYMSCRLLPLYPGLTLARQCRVLYRLTLRWVWRALRVPDGRGKNLADHGGWPQSELPNHYGSSVRALCFPGQAASFPSRFRGVAYVAKTEPVCMLGLVRRMDWSRPAISINHLKISNFSI